MIGIRIRMHNQVRPASRLKCLFGFTDALDADGTVQFTLEDGYWNVRPFAAAGISF